MLFRSREVQRAVHVHALFRDGFGHDVAAALRKRRAAISGTVFGRHLCFALCVAPCGLAGMFPVHLAKIRLDCGTLDNALHGLSYLLVHLFPRLFIRRALRILAAIFAAGSFSRRC